MAQAQSKSKQEHGNPALGESGRFRKQTVEVNGLPVCMVVPKTAPPNAPPLILVHGLGLSHRYMMPVAHELALDYRVYVPDQPGFGDSGHPKQILDMAGLADGLADWMAALRLPRAAFLGNSQGCQIIAQLAVRRPELVACAILQGPTAPPEERTWLRQFIRWRQNSKFAAKTLVPITWEEYRKSGYLRVLWTFHHSLHDRMEEQAPRIEAPTLVVRGQLDPICRAGWAHQIAALLPRGQLVVIPNVAHTLVYTSPIELANVCRSFLSAVYGPQPSPLVS